MHEGGEQTCKGCFEKILRTLAGKSVGARNMQAREKWVENSLRTIPAGSRILDAGAGECQYKRFCEHLNYVSQDFGYYDGIGDKKGLQVGTWDNSKFDITSDITNIPEPDASFDVIMCTEVLEHLPSPIEALREFSRLLRPGGQLILSAPFASLTHFAPYHFYSGYNIYFYQKWLKEFGFKITELTPNGNYFEYIAQELRRLRWVSKRYAVRSLNIVEYFAIWIIYRALGRFSKSDTGSHEILCYGYHVKATKL